MKTNRMIERPFNIANRIYGKTAQRSKDEYFNATLLLGAYNKCTGSNRKINGYLRNDATKVFVEHLSEMRHIPIKKLAKVSRGKGGGTWLHPALFYDFALWLSPEFKLQVFDWLDDNVVWFRNESGSNYYKMQGVVTSRWRELYGEPKTEDAKKKLKLMYKREADMIRGFVGLEKPIS